MIFNTTAIFLLITLVIILSLIFITGDKQQVSAEKSFFVLGTIIYLKAFGRKAEKAIEEAMERLTDIDNKMSAFKDYSEISRINKNAGKSPQSISEDTFYVIKEAIYYSNLLEGTFDPTIRPLVSLWGIGTKNEKIPERSKIDEKLKLVNYRDIIVDVKNTSIKLKKENQSIDVGGIAKGYAADEVKNIFKRYGIKNGLIDLGGNILTLGSKTDDSTWNVGIQDPFGNRGEFIGVVSINDKSVVTSGNYERFFMKDGKSFHHILNPKTGYPSESKIVSATIISNKSIQGDGLSTGVYIMGVKKSLKLIESLDGIDAIFITENKEVYTTSRIKTCFKLSNKEFKYQEIIN